MDIMHDDAVGTKKILVELIKDISIYYPSLIVVKLQQSRKHLQHSVQRLHTTASTTAGMHASAHRKWMPPAKHLLG
jgi:hypothetical protein